MARIGSEKARLTDSAVFTIIYLYVYVCNIRLFAVVALITERERERERERDFYKLWLANKANRLRQGLDDPAHFIKLYHKNDIHAGTKFVHS